MVDYTIRRMNKGDTKQLSELEKVCFSVPWSEQSFAEEFENDLAVYFIAEQCGNLIGYIGFWRIIDEGHITNIAVSPDFRRKGIATALLNKVIFDAKANKYASVVGFPVKRSERYEWDCAGPIRLYEKAGFRKVSEHGETIIVKKELM